MAPVDRRGQPLPVWHDVSTLRTGIINQDVQATVLASHMVERSGDGLVVFDVNLHGRHGAGTLRELSSRILGCNDGFLDAPAA